MLASSSVGLPLFFVYGRGVRRRRRITTLKAGRKRRRFVCIKKASMASKQAVGKQHRRRCDVTSYSRSHPMEIMKICVSWSLTSQILHIAPLNASRVVSPQAAATRRNWQWKIWLVHSHVTYTRKVRPKQIPSSAFPFPDVFFLFTRRNKSKVFRKGSLCMPG